ncbi:MAG: hypothetical protein V9F02_01260 [Chitinophagaceae bacterium]
MKNSAVVFAVGGTSCIEYNTSKQATTLFTTSSKILNVYLVWDYAFIAENKQQKSLGGCRQA